MPRRTPAEGPLWTRWLAVRHRRPRKIVVVDATGGTKWTADALSEEALRYGGELAGLAPGTPVAFRAPNGGAWLALFLALQRARLAAIPLDGSTPDLACRALSRRFGAGALAIDGSWLHLASSRSKPDCCCVKVTSGSAATPKAVFCRAEHLLADGENIIRTMKIRANDVNLGVIPLGHSYGLGNLVMPLILQGTAIVCASEYVPRQIVDWIDQYGVTVFPGVPALFRVLAALPVREGAPRSLRTAISAGAVLAPAVAQSFHERFGLKVHNFYGSSETGGICYDRSGAASLQGRSVGRPMDGVKVEIQARRVHVQSAAVATRSGRWRLGDFGEWNRRGELVLLGRAGQGANIGGKKVHPLEVEQALRSLPGVTDATAWLAHQDGRDLIAAAVETLRPRAKIEQALAGHLPAWKWPKVWAVIREFPRTARGKADIAGLRRRVRLPAG